MSMLEFSGYKFREKVTGIYEPATDCSKVDMLAFGADADCGLLVFVTRNEDDTHAVVSFCSIEDEIACNRLHKLYDSVKSSNRCAEWHITQNYAYYMGGIFNVNV